MPVSRSSGDTAADSRFSYAMAYRSRGDLGAAAELVEQALECAPAWAAGWFALGDILEQSGCTDRAVSAFHRSLEVDPYDEAGAGVRLARLGAVDAGGAMTPTHVAALFDEYAERFEASLVQDLSYRGPALLLSAVSKIRQPPSFGHALDLGCGTGLAAAAFRTHCASLDGVDLSARMLDKARRRNIYRVLERDNVLSFLERQPEGSADLILAADVFVYLGDLHAIFEQAARVLARGGLFAFSAQRFEGPDSFILSHDMRYAHSHHGIERWAASSGLTLLHRDNDWARTDRGIAVPGMIVVLGLR